MPRAGKMCSLGCISLFLAFIILSETASAASTFNFAQCAKDAMLEFKSHPNSSFLVDKDGHFTSSTKEAWGIRYGACNNLCRPRGGWEPFHWHFFSTSVSSWVLPWLALTAQLPYETRSGFSNLMSLMLALGSPMLITYSLCLTVLNSRWINRYFRSLRDDNEELGEEQVKALKGARVFLRESQHVPIKIRQSNAEFAQLVVLPENRKWWESLGREVMKSKRQWTYSLLAQVAWVIITEFIAIVDYLTSAVESDPTALGLAVNSLWIWMIPVTLGWVWVGTQNSASTIREALMSAEASVGFPLRKVKGKMIGFADCSNENSPMARRMDLEASHGDSNTDHIEANNNDHMEASNTGHRGAIEMRDMPAGTETKRSLLTGSKSFKKPSRRTILGVSIAGYALEPGPIFNYARVWNHLRIAEYVGNAFCALNANLRDERSIQGGAWISDQHRWKENLEGWRPGTTGANTNCLSPLATDETTVARTSLNQEVHHEVTPAEIERYIFSRSNNTNKDPPGLTQNFIIATVVALILQWGTTGPAIIIAYQTPVKGLSCKSLSYLIFGTLATLSWCCLVGSAFLSHKYSAHTAAYDASSSSKNCTAKTTTDLPSIFWAILIVVSRFMGNMLACINSFWLLTISLLQFTHLYDSCWCSASVLQYGKTQGWVLLWATNDQILDVALSSWILGVILSVIAVVFAGLFFVLMPGEEIFKRPAR